MIRRATTDLGIRRTYYEGVSGPVWVTHEQRGPERVTSLLVIDGWRAAFEWPPGVTRSMLEDINDRMPIRAERGR